MTILRLPKKERPIGLYIFCNRHKKFYRDDTKIKCKCEDLIYKAKVHIPGAFKKCKTKNFQTTDLDEVLQLFRTYKKELSVNSFQNINLNVEQQTPILFTDCMIAFMAFLRNEGVPFHLQIPRTKIVIQSYLRALKYIGYALKENNIDPTILKFTEINETMVGFVSQYLSETRKLQNKTFNNNVSCLKRFSKYIINTYGLKCKDYISAIPKKREETTIKSLYMDEFWKVLERAKPENSWKVEKSGKRRNFYKPWLITAFKLGLFTGARREEVVKLKWDGIKLSRKGEMSHIEVNHFKANRRNKQSEGKGGFSIKKIPVNLDLEDLLMELGYNENKNTDKYILAPEETIKRETMMTLMTMAFSSYYKQLENGEGKLFKHLRKTYITWLYIQQGDDAHKDTSQTLEVMLHNYVDLDVVMEARRQELKKMGRLSKKKKPRRVSKKKKPGRISKNKKTGGISKKKEKGKKK